jgi:hypothetical protein
MAKIVTLFFANDKDADQCVKMIGHQYFSFVETVTNKRLDRIMNYRRYQTARRGFYDGV